MSKVGWEMIECWGITGVLHPSRFMHTGLVMCFSIPLWYCTLSFECVRIVSYYYILWRQTDANFKKRLSEFDKA